MAFWARIRIFPWMWSFMNFQQVIFVVSFLTIFTDKSLHSFLVPGTMSDVAWERSWLNGFPTIFAQLFRGFVDFQMKIHKPRIMSLEITTLAIHFSDFLVIQLEVDLWRRVEFTVTQKASRWSHHFLFLLFWWYYQWQFNSFFFYIQGFHKFKVLLLVVCGFVEILEILPGILEFRRFLSSRNH